MVRRLISKVGEEAGKVLVTDELRTKYMQNLRVPEVLENDVTKVNHLDHGIMHFMACADDSCILHINAKNGAKG